MKINTPKDLSRAMREIRKSDYTSIGSYTLICVCADGAVMRPSSALATYRDQVRRIRDNDRERIIGIEVFWEGPVEIDCETNEPIQSTYGDPDEGSIE